MPRFFAAVNGYASETDIGFANTWGVLAFDSRKARDAFVDNDMHLATRAIARSEIARYIDRQPRPFSGEKYSICIANIECPGLLGEVAVASEYAPNFISPLNQ